MGNGQWLIEILGEKTTAGMAAHKCEQRPSLPYSVPKIVLVFIMTNAKSPCRAQTNLHNALAELIAVKGDTSFTS